jgi:hypothetical protein
MRVRFVPAAMALVAATLWLSASPASAASIHLHGKFIAMQVARDCINAGGKGTDGIGAGGYGCKTDKGSVKCTSGGDCYGSCGNCSAARAGGDENGLLAFLRPSAGMSIGQ